MFGCYRICGLLMMILGVGFTSGDMAAQQAEALQLSGDVAFTHDPSIAKDGETYYVFATGKAPDGGQFPIRCSTDLHQWKLCGHVFDAIPQWIQQRSPGTKELWAPDISHEHGEYRLYYAYSLFGVNTSGIGLATNRTLDRSSPQYTWVDKGLVLESKATDDFNAIDPNYVQDEQGRAWLAFGSFWTGIKMRKLDASTGLRATGRYEDLLRGVTRQAGRCATANVRPGTSDASAGLGGHRSALSCAA